MANLFRKLRARALSRSQRLTNYMLYALGEIILVVIGILIAIQVNNYNEEKIRASVFSSQLQVVERELLLDLQELEDILAHYNRTDSIMRLVLNERLTAADYRHNTDLKSLLASVYPLDPHTHGIDDVTAHMDDIPAKYTSLTGLLNDTPVVIAHILDRQKEVMEYMLEVNKDWSEQYDWFRYLQKDTITEPQIRYLLEDPIYKNKVTYFQIITTGNLLYHLRAYQENAYNLLIGLKETSHVPFDSLMKSIGQTDLVSVEFIPQSKFDIQLKARAIPPRCDPFVTIFIHNTCAFPVKIYQYENGPQSKREILTLNAGQSRSWTERKEYYYSVENSKQEVLGYFFSSQKGAVELK